MSRFLLSTEGMWLVLGPILGVGFDNIVKVLSPWFALVIVFTLLFKAVSFVGLGTSDE